MCRHREIEVAHHRDELGPVALLQPRIRGKLLRDRRVALALVVVRRVHRERRVELQQLVEEAVVERLRVAAGKVGAAGGPDEQRVAGERAVLRDEAHRVARVPRGMQHPQPQLSHGQHLAVVEAHVHERRRARAMHHHRYGEPSRELPRPGEVVGMRVRVDQVPDPQAVPRRERDVAVDLAQLRIDQRARAGVGAADEVGLAAAGGDLLEDHCRVTPGEARATLTRRPDRHNPRRPVFIRPPPPPRSRPACPGAPAGSLRASCSSASPARRTRAGCRCT